MRTQLGLADDPSVRINNFPFLIQAISGRYRSVDVTADHIAVGPLRDVQVRSQLRDVRAPLSEMLGDGPRTVTVREVEGTARIGAPDVERLIREAAASRSTSSTSTGSTPTGWRGRSTTARTRRC